VHIAYTTKNRENGTVGGGGKIHVGHTRFGNVYATNVRTFPEQPSAPQVGKHEMLAQHSAQHNINLLSSTASSLPMFAFYNIVRF
jgi:hypothetical protein